MNALSQRGVPVYVHGDDGQDPRIRDNKLGVSTWYAAKGTERRVCVVFGFAADSMERLNPAYVALTRSFDRLIVVHDDAEPSKELVQALRALAPGDVRLDARTTELVADEAWRAEPARERQRGNVVALDGWRSTGSGRWIRDMVRIERAVVDDERAADERADGAVVAQRDLVHDGGETYRVAVLIRVEMERTNGACRRLRDLTNTVRLNRESHGAAIANRSHARFVPPSVPVSALLEPSVRRRVDALLRQPSEAWTVSDWCFVACACNAWYGFQHALHQLAPYDWMDPDEFGARCTRLQDRLAGLDGPEFDVRLSRTVNGRLAHVRCDVRVEAYGVLVLNDEFTHSDRIRATIVAAMHAKRRCVLFDLRTAYEESVSVDDPDELLARMV